MSAINKYFNDTITLPVIHHDYKTYDWNSAKYGTIVVDPKNNNIDDNFFDELYKNYNINRVKATRMLNSNASLRGAINELLITNYK